MLTKYIKQIGRSEYDALSDILYVHFLNDNGDSYGDDFENGVELFRDSNTDEITGFQVYNLKGYKCEQPQEEPQ